MATRVERDPLGELHVPADAYYGVQTQRAVENFPISGFTAPPALVTATVLIKQACARANASLARLDRSIADAIISAADEILGGAMRDQFIVDVYQAGAGTSHNMNANEVLANRAAEMLGEPRGTYQRVHPNDHVNMGQSTNDVFPTATRLSLLLVLPNTIAGAQRLPRRPGAQATQRRRAAARGRAGREVHRVRRDPQDGPHASAGCRADHDGTGVRRLCRERAACGAGAPARGREPARTESRRDSARHRAQRGRRCDARSDCQPGARNHAAATAGTQPVPRHAEHGRRAGVFRRAASARG